VDVAFYIHRDSNRWAATRWIAIRWAVTRWIGEA